MEGMQSGLAWVEISGFAQPDSLICYYVAIFAEVFAGILIGNVCECFYQFIFGAGRFRACMDRIDCKINAFGA